MSKNIIAIENDGILVKVPQDIKKPFISNWNDGTTTLEFKSETYEMEYDSDSYTIDENGMSVLEDIKEITLPVQGNYEIKLSVPKRHRHLVDGDKWLWLKQLPKLDSLL